MIILEYGSNVDVHENCRGGYTPLIWAAAEGHDRVVEVLIRFSCVFYKLNCYFYIKSWYLSRAISCKTESSIFL